jgi:hypothetical protein
MCRCVYYVGHKDERAKKFATEVASLQFNVLVTTYEYIMRDRTKLSKVRTACCTSSYFSHQSTCNAARGKLRCRTVNRALNCLMGMGCSQCYLPLMSRSCAD